MHRLLVSYVPLLRGSPGVAPYEEHSFAALMRVVDEHPTGEALACIWAQKPTGLVPIFIIERAQEIADHLREWSEGSPGDWFELQLSCDATGYSIALFPIMEKSIERHARTLGLLGVDPALLPVPDEKYTVIFKPLRFRSNGPSPTFKHVLPLLLGVGSLRVQLLDPDDYRSQDVPNSMEHSLDLGTFRLVRDGEYTQSLLDEGPGDMTPTPTG